MKNSDVLEFILSPSIDQINFCGVHDSNLRCLERHTSVKITPNSEGIFNIIGEYSARKFTKQIMNQMSNLLQNNYLITHEDIKLLIEQYKKSHNHNQFTNTLFVSKYTKVKVKNLNQKEYLDAILNHDITFGIGPAGTGKTYLAIAAALHELKCGNIKKIILTRPVVENDEHLGFLPGTLEEKIDPYIKPLYDAIYDMLPVNELNKFEQEKQIELAPLAYMRGRTLSNAFIILDEAQNSTMNQMKMFLTRLGENSKMVITGDISQSDLKNQQSGLIDAISKLQNIQGIVIHEFNQSDVVRHYLVKKIISAYEKNA